MPNYIISVGGSLVAPDAVDIGFVKKLAKFISVLAGRGNNFFIVTGGGHLARKYQAAARQIGKISNADLDWLGIAATKANAELLRTAFGKSAHQFIASNPTKKIKSAQKIIIFSGWKPGASTDYDAVKIAETYGIKTVINLSNIDYVYDSDPRKNKKAKKVTKMTWKQFKKLFGSVWNPGANIPFDPVAARSAEKLGLQVVILNGRNLKNFQNFLIGKKFRGTIIV